MISIPLTQGKVALIDDEDAELAAFRWHAMRSGTTFYARRDEWEERKLKATIRLHRAVWARAHPGEPPPPELDHRDGDGLNCRRVNLRAATHAENCRNQRILYNNTSGFKGVVRKKGRWYACIRLRGVPHSLGYFATREEAARVYDGQARILFGEFATLNFPLPGERPARLDAEVSP
jgi:hypothetical protein